jgi:hypothetical protein
MKALDSFFTHNYNMLVSVANGLIYKYSRTYEPELIVNSSYFYLSQKDLNDKTDNEIQKMCITFIRNEIAWQKSYTNTEHKPTGTDDLKHIAEHTEEESTIEKDVCHLKELYKVNKYYETCDKINQIVVEAYIKQGKRTVRDLAQHFDISRHSAHQLINDMKQAIKETV